jgi:uncharacterized membrane protein YgcG
MSRSEAAPEPPSSRRAGGRRSSACRAARPSGRYGHLLHGAAALRWQQRRQVHVQAGAVAKLLRNQLQPSMLCARSIRRAAACSLPPQPAISAPPCAPRRGRAPITCPCCRRRTPPPHRRPAPYREPRLSRRPRRLVVVVATRAGTPSLCHRRVHQPAALPSPAPPLLLDPAESGGGGGGSGGGESGGDGGGGGGGGGASPVTQERMIKQIDA